jgi:heme O synthase-like polyprenyltransferase
MTIGDYSWILVSVSAATWFAVAPSPLTAIVAGAMGVALIVRAFAVWREQ